MLENKNKNQIVKQLVADRQKYFDRSVAIQAKQIFAR